MGHTRGRVCLHNRDIGGDVWFGHAMGSMTEIRFGVNDGWGIKGIPERGHA